MTRARRIMPLVILDLLTTQKTDRVVSPRCPERKLSGLRDTRNHRGISRFLEDDQIRSGCDDRFRECLLTAVTTKADVVTQQSQRHAFSPDGTTTKYGSPNKTSRP